MYIIRDIFHWLSRCRLKLIVLFAAAVWGAVLVWPWSNRLNIVFCSVGQGDAAVISRGFTQVLIDAGPQNKAAADCLARRLPFFDHHLEAVIVSHPQAGHFGGLPAVLNRYQVDKFIFNGHAGDSKSWAELSRLIKQEGSQIVTLAAGDKLEFDEIEIDVTPTGYGRIAAQAAKQVILQKLQEAEKQSLYEMFKDREEELLTATVTKVEPNWVTLEIEGMTVSLPWKEQIPGEHYYTGKRIRVYLDKVELTGKGPQLRISRTHRGLVRKLLELEIPEVRNGDVEIKAIARDPGFRSKVAVVSTDPRIDPIGACVGQKGVRIQAVMEELNGERVDMIEWSDDPIRLISTALQPAAISAVIIVNDTENLDEEGRRIKRRAAVFVEEAQRPMAIGKKGQNIRLATELSGYELDMYNYEELPAFKAKLAELTGSEALKMQEMTSEQPAEGAAPDKKTTPGKEVADEKPEKEKEAGGEPEATKEKEDTDETKEDGKKE